jgi:hypothetical protein
VAERPVVPRKLGMPAEEGATVQGKRIKVVRIRRLGNLLTPISVQKLLHKRCTNGTLTQNLSKKTRYRCGYISFVFAINAYKSTTYMRTYPKQGRYAAFS